MFQNCIALIKNIADKKFQLIKKTKTRVAKCQKFSKWTRDSSIPDDIPRRMADPGAVANVVKSYEWLKGIHAGKTIQINLHYQKVSD